MAEKRKPTTPAKRAAKKQPSSLYIRVYESGEKQPAQTVTIPLGILKLARRFVPARAKTALEKEGIDLDQVIGLAEQQDAPGVLLEVDDHKRKKRVVVSIEAAAPRR